MKQAVAIRSGRDRLRYTFLFESLIIVLLVPAGAYVFDRSMADIGALAIVLSLKAMVFNVAYNWLFDLIDVRAGRIPTRRSFPRRVVHATGFEIGLVLTSLPIVIWWLNITLLQALIMDLAVTSFIVIYTLVFTWCYDVLFPIEQPIPAHS